jgi:hypothetical protein
LTFPLTWLIGLSGHELEADGKLDEALDRYISSLHVALHFGGDTYLKWAFQEIADWGAVKGQTPERLRLAIQKLEALKDADQSFERAIKNQYIQERRWTEGGKSDDFFPRTNQSLATAATIDMIMPWERWRGVRALNVVTADVLNQLQLVQMKLNSQEVSYPNMATVHLLPPTAGPDSWWWVSPGDIGKFESTFPSPEPMSNFGSTIARDLVEFEALRRGTMIVLALQAYRLEHGELPDSLEKLARGPHNNWKPPAIGTKGGAFFNTVLLDPYSGEPFRYFPRGLPEFPKQSDVLSANPDWTSEFDSTLSNIAQAWQQKSIVAGMPGIWSTGPDLIGKWVDEQMYDPDTMENVKSTPHLYYWSRWPGGEQGSLPNYAAWPKGIWFPIPERKEMMEGKDR